MHATARYCRVGSCEWGSAILSSVSQRTGRVLVFLSSAAVLVIEVLAGRLIAPHLGVSLETFTGIIGTILAGISIGAWAGGAAADREQPRRLIGPLLSAAGVATMLSPPIVDVVGPALVGAGSVGIVLLAAMGFFAPAALLSAIPPVVVKDRLQVLTETGTVVGSYSAVGTAGALFGTFVTGFVLIAAAPTRPIMLALGSVLVAVGVGLTVVWRSPSDGLASVVIALFPALFLIVGHGPCEFETTYHCAIIDVDPNRPTGRLLWLDRTRNSYVDLADPTYIEFNYLKVVNDVLTARHPQPQRVDAVAIGGGGFTFPALLDATRPGSTTRVLEIDPELIEIGESELGLDPRTDVIVGDARNTLRSIESESVDVVLGDAFSGLSVPWHLTTAEFIADIERVLRPGGIYVLNLIDYKPLSFVRSEVATLQSRFDHVAVIAPPHRIAGDPGGNFVLYGSDQPLDWEALQTLIDSRDGDEAVLTGDAVIDFVDGASLLTDDFAPVDQMLGSL